MRLFIAGLLLLIAVPAPAQDYQQARERMVRAQIEGRGVQDASVLQAMRTVPRHAFVPDRYAGEAYADRPLPIGHGQTISQPYMVAYMTELLDVEPGDRVLEIGTGSGYQAAVLAEITDSIYTIEIVEELATEVRDRFRRLGYDQVTARHADGYYGWPEHAPFDAIVVTAAAEFIPPPLLQQLKEGGRMVIPVGSPFFTQTLTLVEKHNDATTTHSLIPVRFVPFRRAE